VFKEWKRVHTGYTRKNGHPRHLFDPKFMENPFGLKSHARAFKTAQDAIKEGLRDKRDMTHWEQ
jgi:hypothetical protein